MGERYVAESTELRRASENVIGCKETGERVKLRDKRGAAN